jgi:hypothetical protein
MQLRLMNINLLKTFHNHFSVDKNTNSAEFANYLQIPLSQFLLYRLDKKIINSEFKNKIATMYSVINK